MITSRGEVSAIAVEFMVPNTTTTPSGKAGFDNDVDTSAGWRDLDITIQCRDDFLRLRRDHSGLGVPTVIEVDPGEGVINGKDEPDAAEPASGFLPDRGLEVRPCSGIGRGCWTTSTRVVRYLLGVVEHPLNTICELGGNCGGKVQGSALHAFRTASWMATFTLSGISMMLYHLRLPSCS